MSNSRGGPTWSCAHVREQLGAYVVGGLEPDEHRLVAGHLGSCAACSAEHAALSGLPALLDHAAGLELEPPRPALEERVLDAVARERGRRRRPLVARRLLPARARVAAAAALAGGALGAAVMALAVGGDEEGAAPAARTAAPARYAVALDGTGSASGRAALVPEKSGTSLYLALRGLPRDRDALYEVRCEGDSWSASAGTFRADRKGHVYATFFTAARVGEYERIRVVRRQRGRTTDVVWGRVS
jgi:hypothetical protein